LDDALALWRGEPLAEFRYEAFAREEIARLEEFHLTLVEERAEAKLAISAHAEVVGELESLARAHPLRERLRAQLMLALYRSGRRVGVDAETPELARVSQAVAVLNGAGPLYDTLHTLVEGDGEPSPVHRFLARLPALLRERETGQPLLVTTGYELALERALEEV